MSQKSEHVEYLKKKVKEYIQKGETFLERVSSYYGTVLTDETEIAPFKTAFLAFKDAYDRKEAINNQKKSLTLECHEKQEVSTAGIRDLRKLIEASPLCTPAIMEDLGLNNTKRYFETDEQKPELTPKLVAGTPQVKYRKNGFTGIRLFCIINNGEFRYEETVITNIYKDTRPRINPNLPEVREYYAYYLENDKIVGQKSNMVKIILEAIS
ncbi:hypothetical protein [Ancylomarina sp.]|uniref:hypothetical protein n=1 Tax=Ancylomarina sp. TaxID=1970196 RepID=UPI003569AD52